MMINFRNQNKRNFWTKEINNGLKNYFYIWLAILIWKIHSIFLNSLNLVHLNCSWYWKLLIFELYNIFIYLFDSSQSFACVNPLELTIHIAPKTKKKIVQLKIVPQKTKIYILFQPYFFTVVSLHLKNLKKLWFSHSEKFWKITLFSRFLEHYAIRKRIIDLTVSDSSKNSCIC